MQEYRSFNKVKVTLKSNKFHDIYHDIIDTKRPHCFSTYNSNTTKCIKIKLKIKCPTIHIIINDTA